LENTAGRSAIALVEAVEAPAHMPPADLTF
jgi:hypothetical protein